jgi:hypothetical protein
MKRGCIYLLLVAMVVPCAVHAQDPEPNPAVSHLMKAYNLDLAEAQRRIDRQAEILKLSERLNTENDAAYADMYIKHEPNYKIVVMFADNKDRQSFWESLSPKIRPYVKLKTAKRSRAIGAKRFEELNAPLRRLSVPFASKYDLETERFVVTVELPEDVEQVRPSCQQLANSTRRSRSGSFQKPRRCRPVCSPETGSTAVTRSLRRQEVLAATARLGMA